MALEVHHSATSAAPPFTVALFPTQNFNPSRLDGILIIWESFAILQVSGLVAFLLFGGSWKSAEGLELVSA